MCSLRKGKCTLSCLDAEDVCSYASFDLMASFNLMPASISWPHLGLTGGQLQTTMHMLYAHAVYSPVSDMRTWYTQAARERFNEFLQMSSLPADDADVERLRRERREAAAKDGVKFGDADLPDKFFKLPRIRFLLLLCKELLRINR